MSAANGKRERASLDTSRPTTQYEQTTSERDASRSRERQPVLIVGSGVERGRVMVLESGRSVLGRNPTCDLRIALRGVSREHAVLELSAAGLISIADAGSTNGTYVNDLRLENRAMLGEGDVVRLGPEARLQLTWLEEAELALRLEQYEHAIHDTLTRIANRRYFETNLGQVLARSAATPHPFGVVLFDLDHFKRINDTYGHVAGDMVLREVAYRVNVILREDTRLCRYGGEEFAVVMAADPREIATVAERIRSEVESLALDWRGNGIGVTASVGVVTVHRCDGLEAAALMEVVDRALYRAKLMGRNRVVSEALPPD